MDFPKFQIILTRPCVDFSFKNLKHSHITNNWVYRKFIAFKLVFNLRFLHINVVLYIPSREFN